MVPSLSELIEDLHRRRIGGRADTTAVMAGASGLLLTNASMAHLADPRLQLLSGGLALAYLTSLFLKPAATSRLLPSHVRVPSDADPDPLDGADGGLFIGNCTDSGEALRLTRDELTRHIFVMGGTGVGKTVFAQSLMYQQIARGGGLLWIDAKLDSDNPKALWSMAMLAGRAKDVRMINPGNPDESLTYNPILHGDPDEIASRILTLIPTSEHASPGADHYRQEALQGLTTIISALQRAKLAFNMLDLSVLLMSVAALEDLLARLRSRPESRNSDEVRNFAIFLDKFRHVNRMTNRLEINMTKLKETFGGIGGRMFQFGVGNFGRVMNTYTPDVELFDAIRKNQIVMISLPTMGKGDSALNLAKMLLGDLRTAISWVQALPEPQRPDPPFLCVLDEAGSYATSAGLARPAEQARSARIVLATMVQTLANLDAVSKEFRQIILGNSWTKVYFKIGEHDSALAAADMIGKEMRVMRSLSDTTSASNSASTLRSTPESTSAQASGLARGEREAEAYRVTADAFKDLDMGEAIVSVGVSNVYSVRMSMPSALERAMLKSGPPRIRRVRRDPERSIPGDAGILPYVDGANYGRDSDRYLKENTPEAPRRESQDGARASKPGRSAEAGEDGEPPLVPWPPKASGESRAAEGGQ